MRLLLAEISLVMRSLPELQYIPNVVFVPLCTLFAIMGATAVQMNKKNKKPTS
jgi:hypothetical protein